jgi:putative transposase
MCKVLELPRSTYYYKPEPADNEEEQRLENAVAEIFTASRSNYGTRKIKIELKKKNIRTTHVVRSAAS